MEETEVQKEIESDRHDGLQTAEAKAHHYDASKFDRPSVTVDVVMMSRQASFLAL
jgi:8-oxo-dGTP diphosphatase